MGVCSGHFPSQRRVQTTNPSGLGGTVLQEGDETYAPGEDVLPMGAQTLRSSHACYQHPPSRIRNAGTTTTSVDSYTGDKIKVPGDPGHHWGGLFIPFGQSQFRSDTANGICTHLHCIRPAQFVPICIAFGQPKFVPICIPFGQ